MKLTERHVFTKEHIYYEKLADICKKSNNLANICIYINRQHMLHLDGKRYTEDIASDIPYSYLNYGALNKLLKDTENECYRALPANTAQNTIKLVEQEWKSYFALIKAYKEGKINVFPSYPGYRESGGMFTTVYNVMTFESQKTFKNSGKFYIPKTDIILTTKFPEKCKQLRLVPYLNTIIAEIIYDRECEELKLDNGRYLVSDLGVTNFAACVSNVIKSFLIDGRELKSKNRYFNKEVAELKSQLSKYQKDMYTSNRIHDLYVKRDNVIRDFLHKVSSFLIEIMIEHDINTYIVGLNKEWKKEINMGKHNDQNFMYIPHSKFIDMMTYKCQLHGLNIIVKDESYTSKVSFFDNDYIPTYGMDDDKSNPSGKRVKRGLYRDSTGMEFNADINGALNILRKQLGCDSSDIMLRETKELFMSPKRYNIGNTKLKFDD